MPLDSADLTKTHTDRDWLVFTHPSCRTISIGRKVHVPLGMDSITPASAKSLSAAALPALRRSGPITNATTGVRIRPLMPAISAVVQMDRNRRRSGMSAMHLYLFAPIPASITAKVGLHVYPEYSNNFRVRPIFREGHWRTVGQTFLSASNR